MKNSIVKCFGEEGRLQGQPFACAGEMAPIFKAYPAIFHS
jgi:hypothetical protein